MTPKERYDSASHPVSSISSRVASLQRIVAVAESSWQLGHVCPYGVPKNPHESDHLSVGGQDDHARLRGPFHMIRL